MTFSILAIFTARLEAREEFKRALLKNAESSRKEPGCIDYIVHEDASDPTTLFLYEKYRTREDYEYHRTTDHLKEFRDVMQPLLSHEPIIYRGVEI